MGVKVTEDIFHIAVDRVAREPEVAGNLLAAATMHKKVHNCAAAWRELGDFGIPVRGPALLMQPGDFGKQDVSNAGITRSESRPSRAAINADCAQGRGINRSAGENSRLDSGRLPDALIFAAQILILQIELLAEPGDMAAFFPKQPGHGGCEFPTVRMFQGTEEICEALLVKPIVKLQDVGWKIAGSQLHKEAPDPGVGLD